MAGERWGRAMNKATLAFIAASSTNGLAIFLFAPPVRIALLWWATAALASGVFGLFVFWWCYHHDGPPPAP